MERYIWFVYVIYLERMDVSLPNGTVGDIIYIYTFGNPIIILNTAEAADELIKKRGDRYSSRPHRTMFSEL